MKKLNGIVKSAKMTGSVIVEVVEKKPDPVYKKAMSFSKRFLVDKNIEVQVGDTVVIGETRPISKKKRWTILEIIK